MVILVPMFDLSGVELHLSYFNDNAEGPRLRSEWWSPSMYE